MNIRTGQALYLALTNTDLPEGRGAIYACAISRYRATAERLGRGAGVRGCDADIVKVRTVFLDGVEHIPMIAMHLDPPIEDDMRTEEKQKHEAELKRRQEAAVARAYEAGLSVQDLVDLVAPDGPTLTQADVANAIKALAVSSGGTTDEAFKELRLFDARASLSTAASK